VKEVFVDTGYFIAWLNRRDALHEVATRLAGTVVHWRLVTSEFVLAETLNFFGDFGPGLREASVSLVRTLQSNPGVLIVPATRDGFARAFERYAGRRDKGYSLTDCHSMIVIEDHGITDVLTHDEHFVQAGFVALMRG